MEKFKIKDYIAVKDKQDVLVAAELLEKVGIMVFSSDKAKNKFIYTGDDVKNNFLCQNKDGDFIIQSHYLGDGMSINVLESKVNEYLSIHTNLDSEIIIDKLEKEIQSMKEGFAKIEKILTDFKK